MYGSQGLSLNWCLGLASLLQDYIRDWDQIVDSGFRVNLQNRAWGQQNLGLGTRFRIWVWAKLQREGFGMTLGRGFRVKLKRKSLGLEFLNGLWMLPNQLTKP